MTTPPHLPRGLPRLTALRGFAALAVFGYHIGQDTEWVTTTRLVHTGYVGVGLFFVLSGFVLMWSTPAGRRPGDFWVRRVAKVYPSHLLVALVALVLPVLVFRPTRTAILANLALLQAWSPRWEVVFSLNAVSWSLSCEAFFYLVSPWVFACVHRGSLGRALLALGLWWAGSTAVGLLGARLLGEGGDVWAYTNPAVRSGDFAIGVACAAAMRSGWRPRIPVPLAVVVTALAYGVVDHLWLPQHTSSLLLAPVFALLIVALSGRDIEDRPGLGRHRLLIRAGEVSFAFYLVHELVIIHVNESLGSDAGAGPLATLLAVTLCLGVSVLLALGLHHLWELPCQRRILRWWRSRHAPTVAG